VKKFKDKYLKAKKKQKPSVAAEVVDIIRTLDPPGRFLKKDKDTGWYLDIGDARAKEKTSQALREGAPMIRRQMTEGKYVADGDSDDESPEKEMAKSMVTVQPTHRTAEPRTRSASTSERPQLDERSQRRSAQVAHGSAVVGEWRGVYARFTEKSEAIMDSQEQATKDGP
jgi:hypothetical protein